jgi:hypothetical protein
MTIPDELWWNPAAEPDDEPLTQDEKNAICRRLHEKGLIQWDESNPDASLITPEGMATLLQQLHRAN